MDIKKLKPILKRLTKCHSRPILTSSQINLQQWGAKIALVMKVRKHCLTT